MVGQVGNFELDLTSYVYNLYKSIAVVSPILLYHVHSMWFIVFLLRFKIGRSTNTDNC